MSINLPQKPVATEDDANVQKRRLLGAAVFIALAVILLPLLLDGSGSETRFRRVEELRVQPPRILDRNGELEVTASVNQPAPKPAAPVKAPKAITAEDKPAPPKPTKKVAATPKTEPVTPVAKKPKLAAGSGEVSDSVAWIVQTGSFTDEGNAVSMRDQLRQSSYPAFISEVTNTDTIVFRVKVGPITDLQQAMLVQQRVEGLLGVDTLIRQYP